MRGGGDRHRAGAGRRNQQPRARRPCRSTLGQLPRRASHDEQDDGSSEHKRHGPKVGKDIPRLIHGRRSHARLPEGPLSGPVSPWWMGRRWLGGATEPWPASQPGVRQRRPVTPAPRFPAEPPFLLEPGAAPFVAKDVPLPQRQRKRYLLQDHRTSRTLRIGGCFESRGSDTVRSQWVGSGSTTHKWSDPETDVRSREGAPRKRTFVHDNLGSLSSSWPRRRDDVPSG